MHDRALEFQDQGPLPPMPPPLTLGEIDRLIYLEWRQLRAARGELPPPFTKK